MTLNLAELSEKEYFSIRHVSQLTGVKPYVLRYWESKVGLIKPSRRESGQRRYSRKDIDLVSQIKVLLYDKGLTIQGAKKYFRQRSRASSEENASRDTTVLLNEVKKDVLDMMKLLKSNDFSQK
ncbi:MAG TPA: MerR family transcriptional regulator [Elusimicrobiota bacterium]|nr:MerR family transcriptional regulator [Elusimicrobiota bacterium]